MGLISNLVRSIVGAAPIRCVRCACIKTKDVRFISGPNLYICDSCATDAAARFRGQPPVTVSAKCSFCWTMDLAIELGQRHAICGDCIEVIEDILGEADAREHSDA